MDNLINQSGAFELASLRGGIDDTTPLIALAPDACTVAENVEFVHSMLGERRKGCVPITLPASFGAANLQQVSWMYRHLPVNDQGQAELWALAQSQTLNVSQLSRRQTAAWQDISPDDAIDVSGTNGHRLSAQSLHGKLFLAYNNQAALDRLHVFDGTFLRRTGLAQPSAPTAGNTGAGAYAAVLRYYRVRYIILDGSNKIQARSEPSTSISFTPSGSGTGVLITKPASITEHETHWEIEASTDNVNFYRLSQVVVGTTTYTDSAATTTYSSNPLSATIGDYTLIPSGKFLSVDADRLLIAGSWTNSNEASRVRWTPVLADPGDANDERLALSTSPFLDLDGFEGGDITGMSRAVNGYIYVFKQSHIYQLQRTGIRSNAYEAIPITKARGALLGSLVEAIQQDGQPALYFLDPNVGPCRLGSNGLQWCGRDLQQTWKRVNVNAKVPCHGVYYNLNRQLHFWIAVDGSDYPNFKIVLHVNEMRDTEEGGRRGWVTVSKGSRIATAHCSCMFSDNIDSTTDPRDFTLVPLIGKELWTVGGNNIIQYIQRCDTGGLDADSTGDTASKYFATVKTKPFALAGLFNQIEVKAGALLLQSSSSPTGQVLVQAIRDLGKETKQVAAQFYTTGSESHVVAQLNDLNFSEIYALQLALGDLDTSVTPPTSWYLDMLQLKLTGGNQA